MTATLAMPVPRAHAAPQASLADVVGDVWSTVAAGASAECPVCTGVMHPRWSAGAGVVGGRCEDCGTTLE